jgi:uncharacterized membrane protein
VTETVPQGTPDIGFHLTLMGRLRAYFFAGVLITAPISITFYIAWLVVGFVDDNVARLIPHTYNPNAYLPFSVPGLGLLVVVIILILIGWTTAGMIGRLFLRVSEGVVHRTPVIRSVYSAVKQIFETVLASRKTAFRQVVLIEFPRQGLWRVAFVTGRTPGKSQTLGADGLVNVFIPNTPNIATGFMVMTAAKELVELDLTVEEALKLVVSGGIATPPERRDVRLHRETQPDRNSLTAASRSNK